HILSKSAEDILQDAFERSFSKYIHHLEPAPGPWRMLHMEEFLCPGAWNEFIDPQTQKGPSSLFMELSHSSLLAFPSSRLVLCWIHKRQVAPSITAAGCQTVLAEHNWICDDTGGPV
uniref:Nuclear envelope phosphatase-regulatory subunit 1 n=1 Tax=Sciurus vulgaris TaxID=55149 RepID=A0A8D2D916_SCIVU